MRDRLFTIEDVALYFNVSVSTVRRWIESGKIVGKKAGVQWRFDPALVRKLYESGVLSGASRGRSISVLPSPVVEPPPAWSRVRLARWTAGLDKYEDEIRPDHVVVNDRRGAKLWSKIRAFKEDDPFIWGSNLWHSTMLDLLSARELRHLFKGRRVLLFDELIQHGHETNRLRHILENAGAEVYGLVCIRRRSDVESGVLLDHKTVAIEEVDDKLFSEGVTFISRLLHLFEPPLDVDHLVVRGHLTPEWTIEEFLEKMALWGRPYVVWQPMPDQGEMLAITLDRPKFFDVTSRDPYRSLSLDWNAPCKIRFYLNPATRQCYCSFVVYPGMSGDSESWKKVTEGSDPKRRGSRQERLEFPEADGDLQVSCLRAYAAICMDLSLQLLEDFVASGVAASLRIGFDNIGNAVDEAQLRATFGSRLAERIVRSARGALGQISKGKMLFPRETGNPPPFSARAVVSQAPDESHDSFNCRTELLKLVPRKSVAKGDVDATLPCLYSEAQLKLNQFAESTVGQVLDAELDWGTVSPVSHWEIAKGPDGEISVRRGFFRGEFGVWFEAHESMQTHRDSIIRDTLVLGPAAVSLYLDRAKQSELQATLFDKVFVNLQHDWQADRFGLLYLGWRPYKFGPVPIVPETTDWGSPKRFETFLTERGYLLARRLGARKEAGELYRPPSVEALNWPELYDRNVSGAVRTHTASLVRLYAGIQAKCTTTRTPKKKTSSHPAMRSDPLIVLASARNSRIAYVSGWFEVMHWKKKGEELFPTLKLLVEGNSRDLRQVVMHDIVQFGEPVGLLDDKIDMYRNIGHLRKQLEDLRKEYDACETLLETVDSSPKFESVGDFPMYNLEWAHSVLHAFTHMMRQVLTSCGLDNEKPKLHKSVEDGDEYEDARHYLQQLTALLPDSAVLHDNLEVCIVAAQAGKLTKDMLDALQRAFAAIVRKLSDERTLPNPTATQERAMDGLKKIDSRMRVLSDIESIAPYAIVVISMGNLVSFANASQIAEAANDELAYRLRTLVASHAPGITSKHAGVKLVYLNNRNMILVGRSADEALRCTVEFMSDAMRTFNNINQEHLVPFNLLRAGIAWHEGEKGEEYDGIRPGLLAFRLADDLKQAVGSISISQAVHAKLSPELAQEFDALENAENDLHAQGPLYNRNWREGNDAGVVGGDFVPQKSDGKVPKRLDAPAARQSIDFLLVVALREELEALLGKLGGYRQLPPFENDIHTYFAADVQTTFADGSAGMYEVAVMSLVGMGRPQATKGTTDAIHTFDPRYVLLVGIAGGISAKGVRIGDVLVADQIVDYELQKLSSGKVDTRYELYRADARLLSACQSLIGNRWLELVGTTRPEAGIPKCHIGHIASGDKKIVVGQALEVYQDVWTKLVGVEMEGSGAALAAFQSAKPPGFFMVRGVSDLVDENGDTSEIEKWRPYACDVAASYAVGLLRSGPVVARVGRSGT